MTLLKFLLAVLILWSGGHPLAQAAPEALSIATPDGKQKGELTKEPCPFLHGAYLARFDFDGDKFDGCWVIDNDAIILVTPDNKPDPSDDLGPADDHPPKTKGT